MFDLYTQSQQYIISNFTKNHHAKFEIDRKILTRLKLG